MVDDKSSTYKEYLNIVVNSTGLSIGVLDWSGTRVNIFRYNSFAINNRYMLTLSYKGNIGRVRGSISDHGNGTTQPIDVEKDLYISSLGDGPYYVYLAGYSTGAIGECTVTLHSDVTIMGYKRE